MLKKQEIVGAFLGKCSETGKKEEEALYGGRNRHFQLPFISFKDVTEWQLLLLESAETAVGEMKDTLDREGTSEGGSENQHNQDLERIPRHANLVQRWWSHRSVLIWFISRLWILSMIERCQQMVINLKRYSITVILYYTTVSFGQLAHGQNVISRDAWYLGIISFITS